MDYSQLRARARENLRESWGVSIAAAFVAALLGALSVNATGFSLDLEMAVRYDLPPVVLSLIGAWASFASFLSFVNFILGGVVQLGYTRFLLKQHDGQEHTFQDLFSQFDRFGAGFVQNALRGLYVFLWSLLFIIPGIVKSYSYAMTPFIMAEHPELTASQAIDASKEMMDGYKGDLFMLRLSFIGWEILSILLTLGIGSLWLNPYMNAADAAFYRELQSQQRQTTVE